MSETIKDLTSCSVSAYKVAPSLRIDILLGITLSIILEGVPLKLIQLILHVVFFLLFNVKRCLPAGKSIFIILVSHLFVLPVSGISTVESKLSSE